MTGLATVTCPQCAATLVTDGLTAGQRIQCARCRTQLDLGLGAVAPASSRPRTASLTTDEPPIWSPAATTYSWWATAARNLGIASFLPLVGLAAVVAGIVAVRDILRYPNKRGTGRAVFGIVAGGVMSVVWLFGGIIAMTVIVTTRSIKHTGDPNEIAAMAAQIASFRVPNGLVPVSGDDAPPIRRRGVTYGTWVQEPPKSPNTPPALALTCILVVEQFPAEWATRPTAIEKWLRQRAHWHPRLQMQVEETSERSYTVQGRQVSVTMNVGQGANSAERLREYVAILPDANGPIGVLIITPHEPKAESHAAPQQPPVHLSDQQVQEFFETFGQAAAVESQ